MAGIIESGKPKSLRLVYPFIRSAADLDTRARSLPAYLPFEAHLVSAVWNLQRVCKERNLNGAFARSVQELLLAWEGQEGEGLEEAATKVSLLAFKIGLEKEGNERRRRLGLP